MHNILPWKEWLPCKQFSKYTPYAPNINGRSVLQKSMPDSEPCDSIKFVKQAETSIPHHVHIVQVIHSQLCSIKSACKTRLYIQYSHFNERGIEKRSGGGFFSFGNCWEEKHAYNN
jgi:hypothetical protein